MDLIRAFNTRKSGRIQIVTGYIHHGIIYLLRLEHQEKMGNFLLVTSEYQS